VRPVPRPADLECPVQASSRGLVRGGGAYSVRVAGSPSPRRRALPGGQRRTGPQVPRPDGGREPTPAARGRILGRRTDRTGWVYEEVVPRSGAFLTRTLHRARWHDPHLDRPPQDQRHLRGSGRPPLRLPGIWPAIRLSRGDRGTRYPAGGRVVPLQPPRVPSALRRHAAGRERTAPSNRRPGGQRPGWASCFMRCRCSLLTSGIDTLLASRMRGSTRPFHLDEEALRKHVTGSFGRCRGRRGEVSGSCSGMLWSGGRSGLGGLRDLAGLVE
jgi:hypothetical protein